MTLTERLQKYQLYYQAKLIGVNILPFNKQPIIEQAKFTYSSLRKAFGKANKSS